MNPHKSKPYICILDLLFTMFNKGVKNASVNNKTKNMAQPEAMAQLGLVLKRMIHTMEKYCHHVLPIKISELDLKDGFGTWRYPTRTTVIFSMHCNPCRKPHTLIT